MNALAIAEHDNAALKAATLHAVTAATLCGGEVHILVAGHGCAGAAAAAAGVAGVARVLVADAPQLADGLAENVAAQALALARAGGYSHILAGATAWGKNLLPRVAALLDVGQLSEVIAIDGPDLFRRPIYAGNAIASVQSFDAVKVITVRSTAFAAASTSAAAAGAGGLAPVEQLEPVADCGLASLIKRESSASDRPELSAAATIVAGGRGLGSADGFAVLAPLADRLGAALGASRAAVDAGFAPNDWQVGQTGKIVAPQLYIAAGISGAIQHLAGMKDAKTIVAINKDPEAPIFAVADVGIVGDLFEIVPQLVRELD